MGRTTAGRRGGLPGAGGSPPAAAGQPKLCFFWGGPREGARSKGKAAAASAAEPPSPRPAAAAAGRRRGVRGRHPGRLVPRRPHAHGDVHGRSLALKGLITYLHIIWRFKRQIKAPGDTSVGTHGINSVGNLCCQG